MKKNILSQILLIFLCINIIKSLNDFGERRTSKRYHNSRKSDDLRNLMRKFHNRYSAYRRNKANYRDKLTRMIKKSEKNSESR